MCITGVLVSSKDSQHGRFTLRPIAEPTRQTGIAGHDASECRLRLMPFFCYFNLVHSMRRFPKRLRLMCWQRAGDRERPDCLSLCHRRAFTLALTHNAPFATGSPDDGLQPDGPRPDHPSCHSRGNPPPPPMDPHESSWPDISSAKASGNKARIVNIR